MLITLEDIQKALDRFVEYYNKQKFTEACELYANSAVFVDEHITTCNRKNIDWVLTQFHKRSITNHHVDGVDVSFDGQHALATIQFTLACQEDGDCYAFRQTRDVLLFKRDHQGLYVTSHSSLVQRDC